ncbi:MAG: hypothetical protein ACI8TP_000745 [Acidimicrobiales bacterium]|jgi:hypothetical protein
MHLGVALSGRSWRGDLQRHCRDHVADVTVSLLHEGRDAFGAGIDVVIVDDDTSWLSAPFVNQARDLGLRVVGLYDPAEGEGAGRRLLDRVGIDCHSPASVTSEELLDLARLSLPDPNLRQRFEDLTSGLPTRRAVEDRHVVAVGGPAGSGATEVTLATALGLSRFGRRPVVVDVDETHPSLARRLGLGLHPHLLAAVDVARNESSSMDPTEAQPSTELEASLEAGLANCLATSAIGGPPLPFDVIVGLASRDDWSLVRAEDVGELVAELSAQWPSVVVRLGPQLEDLSRYVDRYEVSRLAAARADHVVAVCDGTSTGLLRFVDWLVDALSLIGDTPVDVVMNRAPSSLSAQCQLVDQLRSIAGDRIGQIIVVGRDRRVERAAWDASLAVSGPFHSAITRLAATLAAGPQESVHA